MGCIARENRLERASSGAVIAEAATKMTGKGSIVVMGFQTEVGGFANA